MIETVVAGLLFYALPMGVAYGIWKGKRQHGR